MAIPEPHALWSLGARTREPMLLQGKISHGARKIPSAATKIRRSQPNSKLIIRDWIGRLISFFVQPWFMVLTSPRRTRGRRQETPGRREDSELAKQCRRWAGTGPGGGGARGGDRKGRKPG